MSRKQDVTDLFNFLIEFLKEPQTVENKTVTNEHTPTLNDIIPSPEKVVDMMKRVDVITKDDSIRRTVTGLHQKVGEANAKLRQLEIERLENEKISETFPLANEEDGDMEIN